MVDQVSPYVFPGVAKLQSPDLHLIAICVCEAFNNQMPAETVMSAQIIRENLRMDHKQDFTLKAVRRKLEMDKQDSVTWGDYVRVIDLNPETVVKQNRDKIFALARHMITGMASAHKIPQLAITDYLERHRTTFYNSMKAHEAEMMYQDYRSVYEDAKKRLFSARYDSTVHT
jgi:hypothetical protein